MSDDVADNVHKYSRERQQDLSELWIDVSTPSVRQ